MVEKELVRKKAWTEIMLLNYISRFIFYFHTLTWRKCFTQECPDEAVEHSLY